MIMRFFRWQAVFAVVATILLDGVGTEAQVVYYSLQSESVDGGDEQQLFFDVAPGIASFEEVRVRTYHHAGTAPGTNLAGDVISSGGSDPTLRLEEGDGTFVASNDNIIPAFLHDAQIIQLGLDDAGNTYRTDLQAAGGDFFACGVGVDRRF